MLVWLASTLRSAGLVVHELDGWRTRGYQGRSVNARGIVVHHTAEARTARPEVMARFLSLGRSDLPGPLCQLYLDRRGEWWTIAAGLANHAGSGGWLGLVGNSSVLGIECANDGVGEPWPERQVLSLVEGLAVLSDRLGISTDFICGHKEWAPARKVDPRGLSMPWLRAQTQARRDGDEVAQFTDEQAEVLRTFADQIRREGSNGGGFAQVLIRIVRALRGVFD